MIENYESGYKYRSYHFVYDYDVYNQRRYDDMSVIKKLEQIEPKIFTSKERHAIEFVFGGTKIGKESLEKVIEKIKDTFETTSFDDVFRFRNWDQRKEIVISPKKTKTIFYITTEMINEMANFIEELGFKEESKKIKALRVKSIMGEWKHPLIFPKTLKQKE